MEDDIIKKYADQMMEAHVKIIDDNFWMVVKPKPRWMPGFIYRAVIKELIEFHQHKHISHNQEIRFKS